MSDDNSKSSSAALAESFLRTVGEIHRNSEVLVRMMADVHSVVVHGRQPVTPAVPARPEATRPVAGNVATWPPSLNALADLVGPLGNLIKKFTTKRGK